MKDGGPAFPGTAMAECGGWASAPSGMTLRDYFAAHANEQDIAQYMQGQEHYDNTREQARYAYADSMIEARERKI